MAPRRRLAAMNNSADWRARNILLALAVLLWTTAGSLARQVPPTYPQRPTFVPWQLAAVDRPQPTGKAALLARYPEATNRLWGRLLPLVDQRRRLGSIQARAYAAANMLPVANDRVTVIITPADNVALADLAALVTQNGATVIRTGRHHIKASVPIPSLPTLARHIEHIDHIRLPIRPMPHVLSEGLGHTGADAWQACSLTGAGAKIAVVDLGFIGLAAAQAAGEIPPGAIERDETGTGIEADTPHGVGVAEIIYDLAPDAELHLVKIGDASDLDAAQQYCNDNGIHVINHSVGWYNINFYDGVAYDSIQPSPVATADDAQANGILWVNAAGNDRQAHALIPWVDDNADNSADWTPDGIYVNQVGWQDSGEVIVALLTWNAWPTTDQDFDLLLRSWKGNSWEVVAASENWQTGTQPPVESLQYVVTRPAYYGLTIRKYSATESPTFILRSWYDPLQYYGYDNDHTPAPGSIGSPADAASVLAVGAIDEDVYAAGPIEWFSAIGPNNGAYTGAPVLIKPDVCGPDDTASWTYTGGFLGTSASSPHIAALACLVHQKFPSYSGNQIRAYLETNTIDLGPPGKDNEYGYGPVLLPALAAPQITQHPADQTVCQADDAIFTVQADGDEPLHYQWYKDGSPLGDDSPTLTLINVQTSDGGAQIWCVVSNDCGSAQSDPAALTLCSDLDGDGDTDLDDLAIFAGAMSGPDQPITPPADPAADLDNDNDCDLADLAIFAANFTGPT